MKEVIIGKEGTQKFAINAPRVSRLHAKITILDNGQWVLEDLNSTNGTYIINENDELVQIKRMNITEFTRIVLADQTSMGFTFYAHHILEDDPANYQQEFRHVLQIHDKAVREKAEIDVRLQKKNMMRFLPGFISAMIGLVLTLLLPLHQKVYGVAVTAVFTTILQALINVYIGKDSKLKTFNSKYAGKLTCPCCAKPLSEMEFKNQMCSRCKAHA